MYKEEEEENDETERKNFHISNECEYANDDNAKEEFNLEEYFESEEYKEIESQFLSMSKELIMGDLTQMNAISEKIKEFPFCIAKTLLPKGIMDFLIKNFFNNKQNISDDLIPSIIILFGYSSNKVSHCYMLTIDLINTIIEIINENVMLQKYGFLGLINLIKALNNNNTPQIQFLKHCDDIVNSNLFPFIFHLLESDSEINPVLLRLFVILFKSTAYRFNENLFMKGLELCERLLHIQHYQTISYLLIQISKKCTISFVEYFLKSNIFPRIFEIIDFHCQEYNNTHDSVHKSILLSALCCITAIYDQENSEAIMQLISFGVISPITNSLICDDSDIQRIAGTILDRSMMVNEEVCNSIITPEVFDVIAHDANEGQFETRKIAVQFICTFISCCSQEQIEPMIGIIVHTFCEYLKSGDWEVSKQIIHSLIKLMQRNEEIKNLLLDEQILETLEELEDSLEDDEKDSFLCSDFASLLTQDTDS